MTGGSLFVDTNVLLRATVDGLPLHEKALTFLADSKRAGWELWISRQVIREYLVQTTRPGLLARPMTNQQAVELTLNLQSRFLVANDDQRVTDALFNLMRRYSFGGKQIHDANIVATMLVFGVDRLVTTNYADMKRFQELVEVVQLS